MRVPPTYRAPLTEFGKLSDEQAQSLLAALQAAPPRSTHTELEAHLAQADVGLPEDDLLLMLQALISLYSVGSGSGWTTTTVAEQVARSPDLDLDDAERTRFVERVGAALRVDALFLAAKTLDVMTEHANVFVGARVLTDVRPIFRDDVSETPAAAVLMQTLKLNYISNGELRTFYAAMDEEDVQKLVKILQRAADKGATLRGLVGEPALPIYLPTEGDENT